MKNLRTFDQFVNESVFINEAKLIDEETGKEVKLPYKTKDFRGDPITVKGFTEPHKSSSSGRIQTDQGEYFPGVAGLKIIGHQYESANESNLNQDAINEALSWGATVEEPFVEKREKMMAQSFKVKLEPINVVGVSGDISEDRIDIHIQFSNGDYIESDYQNGVDIYNKDKQNMFSSRDQKIVGDYWGSTTTVVGDLCLIYRDWIQKTGKLK